MGVALILSADTLVPAAFSMQLGRGRNSMGRQTPVPLRRRGTWGWGRKRWALQAPGCWGHAWRTLPRPGGSGGPMLGGVREHFALYLLYWGDVG